MTTESNTLPPIPLPPVTGIDPAIWAKITDPTRAATAVIVFEVNHSNPNAAADPDAEGGSLPRTHSNGYGYMSVGSQRRPIYDSLHEAGHPVFLARGIDRKARTEALAGKSLPAAFDDVRINGGVDTVRDERFGAALHATIAESVLPLVSDSHNAIAEVKISTTSHIAKDTKNGKGANLMSTFVVEHMLYRGIFSWCLRNARPLKTTSTDLDAALRALVVGWRDGVRSNARADVGIRHMFWWSWGNSYAGEGRHRTEERVTIKPKAGITYPTRRDQWDIQVDVGNRPGAVFADLATMFD